MLLAGSYDAGGNPKNGVKALMGYGYFGEMMGSFGWVWILLVSAVVIALVVWATRIRLPSRDFATEPVPVEILRRRNAASEISAREFERGQACDRVRR